MKRAAIYCRVSTDLQERDGSSLETQEASCRTYADAHGLTVEPGFVFRETFTGIELWERPKLTELREVIRAKRVDVVVCHSTDRLSRDPAHLIIVIEEAEHAGVSVEFVTEPLDSSPEGELIRYVRGYASQVEYTRIRERSARGRKARLDAGKPWYGASPAYGYQYKYAVTKPQGVGGKPEKIGYEEDPDTSWVVRQIFRWAAEGVSANKIRQRLTDEGVPTPSGKSAAWNVSTVLQLIRNPAYKGEYAANRYGVRKSANGRKRTKYRPEDERTALHDVAPALVSVEQWEAAQSRISENKIMSPRNITEPTQFLLRGMVFCSQCGNLLRVATSHVRPSSYRHNATGPKPYGCKHVSAQAAALDDLVWKSQVALMKQPESLYYEYRLAQKADPTANERADLEKQLKKATSEIENLTNTIARTAAVEVADLLSVKLQIAIQHRDTLRGRIDQLEQKRQQWSLLQGRIARMQAFLKSRSGEIDQMDFETKRAVLRSLGVRVKLSPSDDKRIPLADRVEVSVDAFSVPADGGEHVVDFTNATQGMSTEDFVADWDELQALPITTSRPPMRTRTISKRRW